MSTELSGPASRRGGASAACTLRVEAIFRDVGEEQVQAVAAAMIDRAHELANRPECECDVDVSVQWDSPGSLAGRDDSGARARERPGDRC